MKKNIFIPYNLFLDDIRIPYGCVSYMTDITPYTKKEWVIVRNAAEFKKTIVDLYENHHKWPSLISYDHDLADIHYSIPNEDWDPMDPLNSEKMGIEETGYDCAKWLCDFCQDNDLPLPDYLVHSMNPVGRRNIQSYLANFKKFRGS
jgi:hypothetical protein